MLRPTALVLILAWSHPAAAQGFAPRARAHVDRAEGFVGEAFRFDGSGSFDPDAGPEPLSFEWSFPDGERLVGARVEQAFDRGGAFDVVLEVNDGHHTSTTSVTVHVLDVPTSDPPVHSTPLYLDQARRVGWAVNVDSASVSAFDFEGRLLDEVAVGGQPRSLSGDDAHVYVVSRETGTLSMIDAATRTVEHEVLLGHRPEAVARVPGTGALLVTLGSGELVSFDPEAMRVTARLALAPDPAAIAITHDGRRAFISHFITRGEHGQVSVVNLPGLSLETVIELVRDPGPDTVTSGRGVPNLLSAVVIEPSARRVWLGALKSNDRRGLFRTGVRLVATNRVRGLLAPLDPMTLSDEVAERIDTNDADAVSALLFDPRGRYLVCAHPGAARVSIYDTTVARMLRRDASASVLDPVVRFDVGFSPRGLALFGDRLFVLAEHDRRVERFDLSDPSAPERIGVTRLTEDPLPPEIARGQQLFHHSRGPTLSQDHYIACASCHPDGGHDGRTWDFTQAGEGLRNTIDLRGHGGMDHGPVHWSANFDEIQDFENDIVHGFGGTGLAGDGQPPHPPLGSAPNAGRSPDLDALAAYVTSLRTYPASPHRRPDGSLTEAGRRGRALFESASLGCTECHAGLRLTDSDLETFVRHDVGTLDEAAGRRLGEALGGFDTPTLHGLWASAPYLHDGRAGDLHAVFREHDPEQRHGRTHQLTDEELDDLVAYLLQLDGRDDAEPELSGSDAAMGTVDAGRPSTPEEEARGSAGCSATRGSTGWLGWLGLGLIALSLGRTR